MPCPPSGYRAEPVVLVPGLGFAGKSTGCDFDEPASACRTAARLRQGKPGKGGSDVGSIEETFRRNPVGQRAHPVESGQHPEASLASCGVTHRAKRSWL